MAWQYPGIHLKQMVNNVFMGEKTNERRLIRAAKKLITVVELGPNLVLTKVLRVE